MPSEAPTSVGGGVVKGAAGRWAGGGGGEGGWGGLTAVIERVGAQLARPLEGLTAASRGTRAEVQAPNTHIHKYEY